MNELNVNCICDGVSFPIGEATNHRIIMVGKALISKGHRFSVSINCKRNRQPVNSDISGITQGIPFRHLNGSLSLQLSLIEYGIRYYLLGFYRTLSLMWSIRNVPHCVIYLYSHGSIYNAFVSLIARLLNIPVIQEVNEWSDNTDKDWLQSYIYKNIMFKWSRGALAISDLIVLKIKLHAKYNKDFKILKVPVLGEFIKDDFVVPTGKYYLWCGQVDGYLKDVLFMIDSFIKVNKVNPDFRLLICGKMKPQIKKVLDEYIFRNQIPVEKIVLKGFVTEAELAELIKGSLALLTPLWNDQRSHARFPTKIVSFLQSGRPVITCPIGEVGSYLKHELNVLFYNPGDSIDLADKMLFVIQNEEFCNRIGVEGQHLAKEQFDFTRHSEGIQSFFAICSSNNKRLKTVFN